MTPHGALSTEARNPRLPDLSSLPTAELVSALVEEEAATLRALRAAGPQLSAAVDAVATRFVAGGRICYAGAGTGGRLAWLDALECVPTFGVSPERVRCL